MSTAEFDCVSTANVSVTFTTRLYGVRNVRYDTIHEVREINRTRKRVAPRDTTCGAGDYWSLDEVVHHEHDEVNCKNCLRGRDDA